MQKAKSIRNNKNKSISTFIALLFFIGFSFFVFLYLTITSFNDGWRICGPGNIDYAVTGQFGDFIGGVIGTLINAAAFWFLYLTFQDQRKSFESERFESNFFELIKLHRDNVSALKYQKYDEKNHLELYTDREVFKELVTEFLECLQEIRRFSNSKESHDYILPKYEKKLTSIFKKRSPHINLIELITIDLAYCIVFYGVDRDGVIALRNLFIGKLNDIYLSRVINYIQLKPKIEFDIEYKNWKTFQEFRYNDFKAIASEIYQNRNNNLPSLSLNAKGLMYNFKCKKYYAGHQAKLGHYFRHLFQSYKFLNEEDRLNEKEKYFYGKTFRSQLSTYEQALLFINSISTIGRNWEINPELEMEDGMSEAMIKQKLEKAKLITNYNLIKNLPGKHLLGIRYKSYYPDVDYETDEHKR